MAAQKRYLIFAILACVPDRQRTLRELELGRTLIKTGDTWSVEINLLGFITESLLENTGGARSTPSVFSRDGSLLPSILC